MPSHCDERYPSALVPAEAHRHSALPIDPDLAPDDPGEPSRTHQPTAHVLRARQHDIVLAIAAAGFLGALARYELGMRWPPAPGQFPWEILVVNVTGSFLLGMTVTVLLDWAGPARSGPWPRYLVDGGVQDRTSRIFPFGTTVVNIVGSFILGLITGLVLNGHASSGPTPSSVWGSAGLTTWSTVSWETIRLREQTGGRVALLHIVVSVGTSVVAASTGLAVGLL